jgi:3'-5' exoribonuclease
MSDRFPTLWVTSDGGWRRAAMKSVYVQGLIDGARFDAPFAVRSKELRVSRNGDPYLSLELADRTGSISGVYFRPTRDALEVPAGSVVQVRGSVTSYRGLRRVRVDGLSSECAWQPEELIGSTARCAEELRADFSKTVRSITDVELLRLVRAVFGDRGFFERFIRSPGSCSEHHACLGGLLEHTVAVAGVCDGLARRYPEVDRDLLVAAALLHDIGRCDELTVDAAIGFSDEGRLMGHVALGMRRVRDALGRLRGRVRPQRALLLEHAILSHHAIPTERSQESPSTLEALLLHHADAVDADASDFVALLSGPARAGETWTHSQNSFRRSLWAAPASREGAPSGEGDAIVRRTA